MVESLIKVRRREEESYKSCAKRYNQIFVRVDYMLCSTTFLLLLLFHRVCVHFNLYFNSMLPSTNFIYIAHLGIVIEQKIVLTFRIIFTMWNSFTQFIEMNANQKRERKKMLYGLCTDYIFPYSCSSVMFGAHVYKVICYFWCGAPYYSIQSVCNVDCWLDDLIIFT